MRKIAASVLLKMFVNSNERCHTTDCLYINVYVCHYQLLVVQLEIYSSRNHNLDQLDSDVTSHTPAFFVGGYILDNQWFGVGWGYCFQLAQSHVPIRESVSYISI